jgi:hypothetical protein
MRVVKSFGAALAATLILLAPALWNGFPLLQYDSGGYLARWYEGTLEESRSTVYGLFLNLLTAPDFWPAIVVQALLTVWILALVLRVYGLGARARVLLVTVAALSLVTTLPWLVDVLLTDILTGLAVLALHVVVMHPDALKRWERVALFAFIAFAAATHSATLLMLLALIAAGFCLAPFTRGLVARAQLGHAVLALALSAVLLLGANYVVAGRLAWTPGGIALAFGRMLNDGIVVRYLDDHCPDPRLRLCDHRQELPDDVDVFFWGDRLFDRLGRFQGMHDEMQTIVIESLREYPALQVKTALKAWATQLVMLRTGAGVLTSIWHSQGMIENFVPSALPAMKAARQQQGELDPVFAAINRLHVPVAWASMLLLLGVPGLGFARPRFLDLGWLAATVALAILANGLVFGVLSGPHNRYGARLAWMAPFVLLIVLWRARRRAEREIDGGG